MKGDAVRIALHDFIAAQSNLEDGSILELDTDLFAAGLMDSFTAVSLVAFCEERFGSALDLVELTSDNFRSIDALAEAVTRNQKRVS